MVLLMFGWTHHFELEYVTSPKQQYQKRARDSVD